MGYSLPINKIVNYQELINHLYYDKELSEAIPYKVSYYYSNWGFCISYRAFNDKIKGKNYFHVYIDSKLSDGYLVYGNYTHKSRFGQEIWISTSICHPSIANDNLSGIIFKAFLAKILKSYKINYI